MATETCGICGLTEQEHKGRAHAFSVEGQLSMHKEPAAPQATSGIDVVLRLLLIDAGIITPEDIAVMEGVIARGIRNRVAPEPTDGESGS